MFRALHGCFLTVIVQGVEKDMRTEAVVSVVELVEATKATKVPTAS
jgi:hypothetical protein